MKSSRIVLFLAAIVALTGFCGFLFGLILFAENRVSLILLALLVSGVIFTGWLVSRYAKVKKIIFFPALLFFALCVVSGLLYDWLVLPEGFKLIGFAAILAIAGWFMASRIKLALSTSRL